MIFSGLPDDCSNVLTVERPRDVPLLETVDDLALVEHPAVLNDSQTGPLDDQIVQVPRQAKIQGPAEIDCNRHEDGIFKTWEHEIFILAGKGVARDQDGKETPIGEGTALFIPGGETHSLINQGRGRVAFHLPDPDRGRITGGFTDGRAVRRAPGRGQPG